MATVNVNGIKLACKVIGEGPPLLFIHGLGSCGLDWEHQAEEFAESHMVITFDLRGHGDSDKPPGPYSIKMFAADTADLLCALDVQSAHVVGVSLGGGIAFQLAVDAPKLVRTLTIVNSYPEMILRTLKEKFGMWTRFFILRTKGIAGMGAILAPRLFPGPDLAAMRDTFIQRFSRNDQRAYTAALQSVIGWSVTDRLGEIACPVLVVSADQDYTPVANKEAYVTRIRGARLVVIPDSRHALPMERPQKFNAVLAKFLAANE
jgi:pimeloyl-ACP methyl ester carboxylesterase